MMFFIKESNPFLFKNSFLFKKNIICNKTNKMILTKKELGF